MFNEKEVWEVILKSQLDTIKFNFTNYSTMTGFVKQAFNSNPSVVVTITKLPDIKNEEADKTE
jgi:hypothetical protein